MAGKQSGPILQLLGSHKVAHVASPGSTFSSTYSEFQSGKDLPVILRVCQFINRLTTYVRHTTDATVDRLMKLLTKVLQISFTKLTQPHKNMLTVQLIMATVAKFLQFANDKNS